MIETLRPNPVPTAARDFWGNLAEALSAGAPFSPFASAHFTEIKTIIAFSKHSCRSNNIAPAFNNDHFARPGIDGPMVNGFEICSYADTSDTEWRVPAVAAFHKSVYLMLLTMNDISTRSRHSSTSPPLRSNTVGAEHVN